MYKLFKVSLIVVAMFAFVSFPVLAQYGSDTPTGTPSEQGEIFGINADGGESTTIFPTGCNFIESITLKVKDTVKGSIEVKSFGDKNPKNDKGISKKVIEYCGLVLNGFSKDNIESSIVKTKASKDTLTKQGIKNEDIRVFQYDEQGQKWEESNTSKKSESSVNFFYESQSINKYTYLAMGEKASAFNLNYLPFIICGFLLLLVIIVMLIAASTSRRREEEIQA